MLLHAVLVGPLVVEGVEHFVAGWAGGGDIVNLRHVLRKSLPQPGLVPRLVLKPLVTFQARYVVGLD